MTQTRFALHAATYLILQRENKILLIRRFNTGWRDGFYTLLAGHVDGNESIAATMAREAFEEGGIIIAPEDLKVVHVMHQIGDKEYIDFYLVPEKWEGEPEIKEEDKCDDMQWFALDALPENLLPNVKVALEHYKNKIPFSEYTWN